MSFRLRLIFAGAISIFFVLAVPLFFGSTGEDDSYISFDASAALVRTGHLISPNGDFLEQSTSLIWVVLVAIGHAITGLSIPLVGWSLGLIGATSCLLCGFLVINRFNSQWAVLGTISVGLLAPLAYWAVGGMEVTLAPALVLLLALILDFQPRRPWPIVLAIGLALSMLFALRPEQGLEAIAALVITLVVSICRVRNVKGSWRIVAGMGLALTLIGALTFWRLRAFDSLLPQPVVIKSGAGFSLSWALNAGLVYVSQWLTKPWAVVSAVLLTLLLAWKGLSHLKAGQILLLSVGLLNILVVASSRGDWMGNGRLVLSGVVALVVLGWTLVPEGSVNRVAWTCISVLLATQAFSVYALSRNVDENLGAVFFDPWRIEFSGQVAPPAQTLDFIVRSDARYLPNSYFVRSIIPTISKLVEVKRESGTLPLRIGSGDAGFAMYYLHQIFGEDVRLVDQWQLASRDFTSCPGLETTSAGKYVTFAFWQAHVNTCAPPLPDAIIDRDALQGDLATKYEVLDKVSAKLSRWRGSWDFTQELAVKNGLVTQLRERAG